MHTNATSTLCRTFAGILAAAIVGTATFGIATFASVSEVKASSHLARHVHPPRDYDNILITRLRYLNLGVVALWFRDVLGAEEPPDRYHPGTDILKQIGEGDPNVGGGGDH